MDGTLGLYLTILKSFDLLHLPKESQVAIIQYPEIEDDYVKFATALAHKEAKSKSNERPNEEMVANLKHKLRDYCQLLSHAKQYRFETPDSSRNPAERMIPDPHEEFVGLKVELGTFSEIITGFSCFEGIYITYGFTEDYVFLFKRDSRQLPLVLHGMSEPLPQIDEFSGDRKSLEEIFIKSHQTHERDAKETNTLCSLKKGQRYRLCCLLDGVLESSNKEISPNFGAKDRTTWKTLTDCEDEVKATLKHLNLDSKNADKLTRAPLIPLPCFRIHYEKADVEYLLTEDPSDEHSLFLLNRIQYKKIADKDVVEETVVAGHLRNVALLKHAKEFF